MGLLDGDLAAVFGAAFGAVFTDGVLHKTSEEGVGTGGFTATTTDYPVKLCPETIGATERAALGIPASAVKLIVLRSGLPVSADLDDGLTVGTTSYRVIGVETDAAGVSFMLTLVPA